MRTRGPAHRPAPVRGRLLTTLSVRGAKAACAALAGVMLLGACTSDSGTDATAPTPQTSTATTTAPPTDPVIAAIPPEAREYSDFGAIAFVEHFFDRVNEAVTGPDIDLIPALSEPSCDACASLQQIALQLDAQDRRAAAPMFSVRDTAFAAKRDETVFTISLTLESHAVDILNADGSTASTLNAGSDGRMVAVLWRGDSWRLLGAEDTD